MNANDLKAEGNKYFSEKKFNDAISCYTKAIIHDPSIATYYTNRALCYLKLSHWESARQDCRRALELDPTLVKAHYFEGQALNEMKNYEESIACLKRAHGLAREKRLNFADEVGQLLSKVRKKLFELNEEKRLQQEIELQTELNMLLMAEKDRLLDAVKEMDSSDLHDKLQEIELKYSEKIRLIDDLFAEVDERRQKREVPDVFCCKISFDIMQEPVITPSGITYERKEILDHLHRNGSFDPVTRRDLQPSQLVPNLALKEAIDNFMRANPWAEFY